MTLRGLSLLLVASFLATSLSAQTIRGRVVHPDSVTGVAGATIVVRDSAGAIVGRVASGPDGRYAMRLPGPGRYDVQAIRIGFRPIQLLLGGLVRGEERVLTLVMAERPLELATVDVTGNDRCRMSRNDRERFVELWLRVRGALGPNAAAELGGAALARIVRVPGSEDGPLLLPQMSIWNPNRRHTEIDSVLGAEGHHTPMHAITSPDTLFSQGYIRGPPDGELVFDLPNPHAIVSDPFLASHCFELTGGPRDHPAWRGLRFRPIERQDSLTDIAGTLWVDDGTARIQRIEFEYRNPPRIPYRDCRSVDRPPRTPWGQQRYGPSCTERLRSGPVPRRREGLGGSIDFGHLDSGHWFVSRWIHRTPGEEFRDRYAGYNLKVENRQTVRCWDRPPACWQVWFGIPRLIVTTGAVAALTVDGVEVYRDPEALAAIDRIASLQAGRTPAHLTGVVTDAEGRPVPRAIVSTAAPVRAAMTDEQGRFEIRTLPAGNVMVRVTAAAYTAQEHQVLLRVNVTYDVRWTILPTATGRQE